MGRKRKDQGSHVVGAAPSESGGLIGPKLSDAPWLKSPRTQALLSMLEKEGHVARVVGGAVRNALLERNVRDIDIATTAKPDDVLEMAAVSGYSVHPTGLDHGTVTVVCDHQPYEVTTLRKDVSTDGRRATVEFTDDWAADANRRDFTINALYCDRDGNVLDFVGGYADILERRVRFIGLAHQRIREDYLRILRFFRFYAGFGTDPIDEVGLSACIEERSGLRFLSGERIRAELFHILSADGARNAIQLLVQNGILDDIIGDHSDAVQFNRLVEIEDRLGLDPDPVLRLCALAVRNRDDAGRLNRRLKMSRAEATRLKRIGALSDRSHGEGVDDDTTAKAALYTFGLRAYLDQALISWVRSSDAVDNVDRFAKLELPKRWTVPKMPVAGSDVIELGIQPGPNVGLVLDRFEDWWINAGFPDNPTLVKDKLQSIVSAL